MASSLGLSRPTGQRRGRRRKLSVRAPGGGRALFVPSFLLLLCPVKKSKKYQVIKMRAQHGGFRKGAGRPKGSRNRATIAREARQREALATARAENANLSAIDYLLQVLRDPTTPPGRRTEVAKFVAPYLEYRVRVSRSRRGQAKSKT